MHRNSPNFCLLIVFMLLWSGLAGCRSGPAATPNPGPTLSPSSTPLPQASPTLTVQPSPFPTATATPQPLGSPTNPLIIGIVPAQKGPQVAPASTELAKQLTGKTGLTIQTKIFDSYPLLLAALDDRQVHLVWLYPLSYVYAHQRGLADVILLTNHFGVYSYGTQFLAHVDSGFTPYFDPASDKNTTTAVTVLQQFAGKRPCWIDQKSVSGYVLPAGILNDGGITTLEPAILQSVGGVIRALYIQQICDFGATFAISGDPRTASDIQDNLPNILDKVIIIWRTEALIPNLNLSIAPGLPEGIRLKIIEGLIAMVKTPQGKVVLSDANQYSIDDLKIIDDATYDMLRLYLKAAAVDLKTLAGR
jgi:phosphonate transport system substrate-binding protein